MVPLVEPVEKTPRKWFSTLNSWLRGPTTEAPGAMALRGASSVSFHVTMADPSATSVSTGTSAMTLTSIEGASGFVSYTTFRRAPDTLWKLVIVRDQPALLCSSHRIEPSCTGSEVKLVSTVQPCAVLDEWLRNQPRSWLPPVRLS